MGEKFRGFHGWRGLHDIENPQIYTMTTTINDTAAGAGGQGVDRGLCLCLQTSAVLCAHVLSVLLDQSSSYHVYF